MSNLELGLWILFGPSLFIMFVLLLKELVHYFIGLYKLTLIRFTFWDMNLYRVRKFFFHTMPWFIAMRLPAQVVLICFIRVTANTKDGVIDGYTDGYVAWCEKHDIKNGFY
jgi:biotin transporter BioY